MALRVLEWKPIPGRALPDPVVLDDAEAFPPQVVAQVRGMLRADAPRIQAQEGAHPLILNLALGRVEVPGAPIHQIHTFTCQPGTAEIILRDRRTQMIIARYHYLVARFPDGKVIVGDQLQIQQEAQA
jgi:hypothetical protein